MISIISKLPENIVGFKYDGKVTAKDYESILFPAIESAFGKSKDLKMLCQMADSFEGFKAGAIMDDIQLGIKYFRDWKKIAFVSKKNWMIHAVRTFGFLIPGQVQTFKKKKEAISWLSE